MKLVFGNFESQLEIKKGKINLICSESPLVFSRMVYSAMEGFSEECQEVVLLVDEGKQASKDSFFFVGDLCMLDLSDKRILSQAIKKVVNLVSQDENIKNELERRNNTIHELLYDTLFQLHGDYAFLLDWDLIKYIKSSGFGIEQPPDETLFDKLIRFVNISIDLFPNTILCFVNIKNYLTYAQYVLFYELIVAGSQQVLLYEYGSPNETVDFENYLFIDSDYIETSN